MIRELVKQGLFPICHNSLARLASSVCEIICHQSIQLMHAVRYLLVCLGEAS